MLNDLLDTIRNCSFLLAIVHPVRFRTIAMAGDRQRPTRRTTGTALVTLLPAYAAGPATTLAPKWIAHSDRGCPSEGDTFDL